jgi:hypothetical protein
MLATDNAVRRLPPCCMEIGCDWLVPCSSAASCSCVSASSRLDLNIVVVDGVGVVISVCICRPVSRGVLGVAVDGVRMCTRGTEAVSVSMAGKPVFWAIAKTLPCSWLVTSGQSWDALTVSICVAAGISDTGWGILAALTSDNGPEEHSGPPILEKQEGEEGNSLYASDRLAMY